MGRALVSRLVASRLRRVTLAIACGAAVGLAACGGGERSADPHDPGPASTDPARELESYPALVVRERGGVTEFVFLSSVDEELVVGTLDPGDGTFVERTEPMAACVAWMRDYLVEVWGDDHSIEYEELRPAAIVLEAACDVPAPALLACIDRVGEDSQFLPFDLFLSPCELDGADSPAPERMHVGAYGLIGNVGGTFHYHCFEIDATFGPDDGTTSYHVNGGDYPSREVFLAGLARWAGRGSYVRVLSMEGGTYRELLQLCADVRDAGHPHLSRSPRPVDELEPR